MMCQRYNHWMHADKDGKCFSKWFRSFVPRLSASGSGDKAAIGILATVATISMLLNSFFLLITLCYLHFKKPYCGTDNNVGPTKPDSEANYILGSYCFRFMYNYYWNGFDDDHHFITECMH